MSITQKYWLIWGPILAFAGVIGSVPFMLFMFAPTYFAYYAHRKEWSLGKFAIGAFLGTFAMLILLAVLYRP